MKKDKKLLISLIMSTAYALYLISYFFSAVSSSSGAEQAGATIATVIVTPHMVVVVIALLFNIFAYMKSAKGFAVTAAILYAVSIVLFPIYFMFVIIQMILCFVAYSSLKKTVLQVEI